MSVSVVQAVYLHITYSQAWKTFDPYTYVLGQVAVRARATSSGGENPDLVWWEIVLYGTGFQRMWQVHNGEYDSDPSGSWSIGAYKYGDTYYVSLFWYRISWSQYDGLDHYTVRLYYGGQIKDDHYWRPITEIPWP